MKKFLIALPMIAALAACETGTTNNAALTGAALGAATGAAVSSDDDRVKGAVVGGLVGAGAGELIRRSTNGQCVYQNSAGQRYTAACP